MKTSDVQAKPNVNNKPSYRLQIQPTGPAWICTFQGVTFEGHTKAQVDFAMKMFVIGVAIKR